LLLPSGREHFPSAPEIFLLNGLANFLKTRLGIGDEYLYYLKDHLLTIILFQLCQTMREILTNAGGWVFSRVSLFASR
jgi:hypothetical protein